MSTHSLQLLNLSVDYNIKQLDLGPSVYIALKIYGTEILRIGNKEREFTTISPECSNNTQLEIEVNRLIKELETIKKQGKRFFEKEFQKRKDYLEAKSKLD